MRRWRNEWIPTAKGRVIANFAVDLVFPKRCAGCGKRGSWLCERCDAELDRYAAPWCPRCGIPAAQQVCACDSLPGNLERVRAVGPYAGWLRRAIIEFKYQGEWGRAESLGAALATVAADLLPCDGLVPVPLHSSRLRQRGFNQSLLLAREMGTVNSVPVLDVLTRVRRTPPQVHLAAEQRTANVKDAFALLPGQRVLGRKLLLIDDVMTTGATLSACATALLDAGADEVTAGTVAHDRLHRATAVMPVRQWRYGQRRGPTS